MKKLYLLMIAALLLGLATPAYAKQSTQEKTQIYVARLDPLNNSGVFGVARLELEGNQLTVTIRSVGLEAGKIHPQHIHGFADKHNSTCPPPSADTDGDGLVSVGEGAPYYGPVMLPLEPFPTGAARITRFKMTYTIDPADLGPLVNRAVVLHGMTVDGNYIASLPVACGQIVALRQAGDN